MARGDIPGELKASCDRFREQLVEAVAETDDDLIAKYLEGEELGEDEVLGALHRAVATGKIFPVVVAGGSRESDLDLLLKLQAAREAGAVGCSVGRNIFQHEAPERMVRAICAIFKDAATAREAHDAELGEVKAQVS